MRLRTAIVFAWSLTALLQKYVAEDRNTPGAEQTNDMKSNLWKQPARAAARRSAQP
jgi:hypothetical protein